MTKALITVNRNGQSHLLDYLIENTDWDITGMARWRSPLDNIDQHLNKINNAERITLNYADLRDGISIENRWRK